MHGVLKEICRASLIEPTYEEFEDAGIRLTDDQIWQSSVILRRV